MRCPQCHTENRVGRKFCAACGQALALTCLACGFVNDPGDQFCGGCGQALTAIAAPELTSSPSITRLRRTANRAGRIIRQSPPSTRRRTPPAHRHVL